MSEENDKTVVAKTKIHGPNDTVVMNQGKKTITTDADETAISRHNISPGDSTVVNPAAPKIPMQKKAVGIGYVINGRFVIDKLLGRGGMGVVYRALDKRKQEAKDRNPFVAIKILGDEFKRHPVAFVALQREARKSQELAHPNIITVYDFDRDGDIVYMTMEELNGQPLDKYIREHPSGVPVKHAEKIIKSIAQGLAYAHSKNIVHSDLKPGNVFVTKEGNVKVLDFGIARAVSNISEQSDGDKTLFDAAELGGLTPSYASTEMFLGKEPHPSDDVYALGLMSYELYTGDHPFQRERSSVVLEKGLKPNKIKNIRNHQWRTISSALELQREKRIADASIFLKKYEGLSKTVVALAASLVLVVLVLGSFAIFKSPEQGPEIAFENLPPELQNKITMSISSGQEALKFGDINGALIHFNEAYELHPKNEDAVAGLNEVVEKVTRVSIDKSDRSALQDQKSKLDIMLEYPALSDNDALLRDREKILKYLNE